MNDPNRPQQSSEIPGVPPPPPKINARMLWITLLTPSVVMILIMIALGISSTLFNGGETFMTVSCVILCIASAVAWGFYMNTLFERFRGASLVLLILAYPILQALLVFGIFFAGCLTIVAIEGH